MAIELTKDGMRAIFPKAPQSVIDAFVEKQDVLGKAGITHTRQRLAYFFANIEHECGGFTIPNLTENINYTADRMAEVWPNRFSSGHAVRQKYGTAPGWQKKAFDDIYGNRMGNRPGTSDGSTYIGRGGPQWTGRDGYAQVERATGIPAVSSPEMVCRHEFQPEVCAAFWSWKNLNVKADTGDFKGLVRLWNGGTNGMADRLAKLKGNDPIIMRMHEAARARNEANTLPGAPPTAAPPKDVIDAATDAERKTRNAGGAGAATGGAGEVAKQTGTVQPDNPVVSSVLTYTLIGGGVLLIVIATILIVRKHKAVLASWT